MVRMLGGKRVVGMLATVMLALLASPWSAAAHTMTDNFSIGSELWGYCGYRNGGWTMAIQAGLKTHFIDVGTTGPWNNGVDGAWGAKTDNGVKQWQSTHGLTADGCVGSQTWGNISQNNYHRFYEGSVSGADLWTVGNHNAAGTSNYRESLFTDPVGSSSYVAVEIRYAAAAGGPGGSSGWDCRWVQHNTNSASCL